ncbi:MAG: dTDP-4-dehydrorhamnose 3,5-epimerase [Bacteroidota bacterium]|jgi:dTDP-4-dehydrorhamnose 3,5-epimerase
MNVERFEISGPLLFSPDIYRDERGDFLETFSLKQFEIHVPDVEFVQDNQSRSHKNVLRGLHFQKSPFEQGKLVRISKGAVLDIVVDIRPDSPTRFKNIKVELDDQSCKMLWIPPGFAHGFITLMEGTVFNYKCTNYYNKSSESGIRWNDPNLNIDWTVSNPIVSNKDSELPLLTELFDLEQQNQSFNN